MGFKEPYNNDYHGLGYPAKPQAGHGADTLQQVNPNYQTFAKVNPDIESILDSKSVVSQRVLTNNEKYANPTWQTFFDGNSLVMPIATNKNERIAQYRRISHYSICDWCFDEIADDFIHDDDAGEFIKLTLPDRLNGRQQDIIQNEFRKYIGLFQLRNDGYNIIKRFLTEGELAWENIISPTHPDLGIIGVKFLPAEYYETLVDTKTSRPVGILFDTESFSDDIRQMYRNSFLGAAAIFNAITPVSYSYKSNKDSCIPLLYSQITYINSGEYSHDYLISYPLIEKAKQAYYKLSLVEDAAVILRVTRAPERLLFNVSTGKMTQNYADEYVRRFANELKSKKVATPDGGDIGSVYSPVTMLKSYVFGKSDGNDGTEITSVGSSANYDEMADIEYFLRGFLKQFKVPFSRYKTPENAMEKNDNISYEEYSFSRMIIRFLRRFAEGFRRGFMTHLKLRELWDKKDYELKDSEIKVEFTKPVLYDFYETQKLAEAKMAVYKLYADQEEMSKMVAMHDVLGWSDEKIKRNYDKLIEEAQRTQVGQYMADKITNENPPVDFKSPIKLKSDVEQAKAAAAGNEGGDEGGASSEDEGSSAPEPETPEPETKPAEAPTFGLA